MAEIMRLVLPRAICTLDLERRPDELAQASDVAPLELVGIAWARIKRVR